MDPAGKAGLNSKTRPMALQRYNDAVVKPPFDR